MPPSKLNFSLGSLLLAAFSLSALLGGILTLNLNGELYRKQQLMTSTQLFDLAWQIRAQMDRTSSEFYPGTLDELASKKALDVPQRFFTNPRLAELDSGFFTVAGVRRQDMGCVWLYENLPSDCRDGRFALVIQGEALVPVWFSEEQFQLELRDTLSRPGTKVNLNNRTSAESGWPIPGSSIEADRIELKRAAGGKEIYRFGIRAGTPAVPVGLFGAAVILALALFVHQRVRG
jgi:hypothetical protein